MKKIKALKFLLYSALTIVIAVSLQSFLGKSSDFKSVKIGNQVWMTENLNVETFKNGDPIMEVKTLADWKKAGDNRKPAFCYYNNDPEKGKEYGKLYNWYAVTDKRGLAPQNWHIPSNNEWDTLKIFVGTERIITQFNAGKKLKSAKGWFREEDNGTNETGFSALPGGICATYDNAAQFQAEGVSAYWWSSNSEPNLSFCATLDVTSRIVGLTKQSPSNGLSVRCVKDN
jgi:uncharacterized protein (TIGR02145 family)